MVPRFYNTTKPPPTHSTRRTHRLRRQLDCRHLRRLRSNADLWQETAFIVIYDDHGGFYDHVMMPSANVPNPDGIDAPPPGATASNSPSFLFDRLGQRVPAIIASPWVQAGKVDSTQYQHTSVLATLKAFFGLPAFLTKCDAWANSFNALFSELRSPRTETPQTLLRATRRRWPRRLPTRPTPPIIRWTRRRPRFCGRTRDARKAHPEIRDGADLRRTQGEA